MLIADKISIALSQIMQMVTTFVRRLSSGAETAAAVREVELELVCALANDCALHIEEVMTVLDTFTQAEIRQRMDEIYDKVTSRLVDCGTACLKRLEEIVMADLDPLLSQVESCSVSMSL